MYQRMIKGICIDQGMIKETCIKPPKNLEAFHFERNIFANTTQQCNVFDTRFQIFQQHWIRSKMMTRTVLAWQYSTQFSSHR